MSIQKLRFFQKYERRIRMTLKDRVKYLCDKNNISMNKLEEELGFGKGYLSKLGKSAPNVNNLKKIADFFGVDLNYLVGKEESTEQKIKSLSQCEILEIEQNVDVIIKKLQNGDDVVFRFEGKSTDSENSDFLRDSLLNTFKTLKLLSKRKE